MAIDNRKNDFIVRVLREFCREDPETVDTVATLDTLATLDSGDTAME